MMRAALRTASSMAVLAVVVALTLGLMLGLSGSAQAGARYRVTVSPQTTSVTAGHRVVLKGIVRAQAPGRKVFLQAYVNGSWKAVSSRTLSSTSSYSFHPLFGGTGTVVLRVVKPAGQGHAQGISPTVLVTVRQAAAS